MLNVVYSPSGFSGTLKVTVVYSLVNATPVSYTHLDVYKRQASPIEIKPTCAPQFIRTADKKGVPLRFTKGCLAGISYCIISPCLLYTSQAIKEIKKLSPETIVITDVCMCEYTCLLYTSRCV